MEKDKNKIVGAFLGTIVEYYDYSLYGFSAGILASKFFPSGEKITSLMYVFGIYAVAYLMKPLGALFFSRLGDTYGRKLSLRITMIGIAVPTVTIGLLPDYHTAGSISTVILVLCRMLQGFFVAGEYDGAAIYVIEHLGKKYHYTASAITRSTGVAGLLLGIACTNFFSSSIFPEWAWRIPFLLSLPLAAITLYYRSFLQETPIFKEHLEHNIHLNGTMSFIKKRWRTLLFVVLLAGGFGVTYQISIIFMKQYLPLVMPITQSIMTTVSIVMVFIFGISMPISGLIADKFGLHNVLKASLGASIIIIAALIVAIKLQILNLVLSCALFLSMAISPFNALAHGVIVKSFTVRERYRGVSIGHTTGSLLMSGTANYVCLAMMKNFGLELFPLIYIGMFAAIAFASILVLSNKI